LGWKDRYVYIYIFDIYYILILHLKPQKGNFKYCIWRWRFIKCLYLFK